MRAGGRVLTISTQPTFDGCRFDARAGIPVAGYLNFGGNSVNDINENQIHSRPSRMTLLIAVAVAVGMTVVINWEAISIFARIPQIRQALGV
jgi:hypothetical protein